MWIGESFIGEGADAAHVNTVLGHRDGPVGTAWATALATPTRGHAPFVATVHPGLPVQPMTLFVNKADITFDEHGRLTWGAAHAGVAGGVADALADGVIPADQVADLVLIAAVWVSPAAADEQALYENNRAATAAALASGMAGEPTVERVLAARATPQNPFFGQA